MPVSTKLSAAMEGTSYRVTVASAERQCAKWAWTASSVSTARSHGSIAASRAMMPA